MDDGGFGEFEPSFPAVSQQMEVGGSADESKEGEREGWGLRWMRRPAGDRDKPLWRQPGEADGDCVVGAVLCTLVLSMPSPCSYHTLHTHPSSHPVTTPSHITSASIRSQAHGSTRQCNALCFSING